MKLSAGPFDVEYNRTKKSSTYDSDPYIRTAPKEEPEMATDDQKTERYTKAATTIIKTYFVMKMADRVLEKLLK